MTNEDIDRAIQEVMDLCDRKMDGYRPISLRSGLKELGYEDISIAEVVYDVAERGFDYCVDPLIRVHDPAWDRKAPSHSPSRDACTWGPDQLKSRLSCLRSRPQHSVRA